jgi:large subunit ribosomal protein L9
VIAGVSRLQVILKKDISSLGRIGDIVKVREGYARNFLIPRSFAIIADPSNLNKLEHQKSLVELHKKKIQKESAEVVEKLQAVALKVKKLTNEAGKLFGHVTAAEVVKELKSKKYEFDRRDIELPEMEAAGEYDVKIRLPGDVFATVKLTLETSVKKTKAKKADSKKAEAKEAAAEKEEAKAEEPKAEEAAESSTDETPSS